MRTLIVADFSLLCDKYALWLDGRARWSLFYYAAYRALWGYQNVNNDILIIPDDGRPSGPTKSSACAVDARRFRRGGLGTSARRRAGRTWRHAAGPSARRARDVGATRAALFRRVPPCGRRAPAAALWCWHRRSPLPFREPRSASAAPRTRRDCRQRLQETSQVHWFCLTPSTGLLGGRTFLLGLFVNMGVHVWVLCVCMHGACVCIGLPCYNYSTHTLYIIGIGHV